MVEQGLSSTVKFISINNNNSILIFKKQQSSFLVATVAIDYGPNAQQILEPMVLVL